MFKAPRDGCWLCMSDRKVETSQKCESEKPAPPPVAPPGFELWKNNCRTVTPKYPGEKWFATTPLKDQHEAYLRGNPQFWSYMEAKYNT
tara:strand:+ start:1169 stop:1435 length:267 start_codon:yes stop_codon:yes gene_type:complete